MLESPAAAQAQPVTTDSATVVKRYAPPNQRNRLNRRKSAERFDHATNVYGNDADKSQVSAPRNVPVVDHADVGGSNLLNENTRTGFIALEGCSLSDASQLLKDRWAAAIQCFNDTSIDLSERPVMYSDKTPARGGQFRLPHQLMSLTGGAASPGSQMDFLSELHRAISISGAGFDN